MTRKRAAGAPVGETWTVRVDRLDPEGRGVADANERHVAIPGALPGDGVEVTLTWASRTGPWAEGRLLRVLEPSPRRVPVDCAHAPDCVGCPWTALPYDEQLVHKRARVAHALASAGHADIVVPAVVPAPITWGWRVRTKYVVQHVPGAGAFMGAYRPGTHDVAPSVACRASHPAVNAAASALDALLRQAAPSTLRHVLVRTNGTQTLGLLVVAESGQPAVRALAEAWMRAAPSLVGVLEQLNTTEGNAILSRHAPSVLVGQGTVTIQQVLVRVDVGPLAFQQLHPEAFAGLATHVAGLVQRDIPGAVVVDAYGGTGAFAFALRHAASRVVGMDDVPEAVEAARAAAELAGLAHLEFRCGDSAELLASWKEPVPGVVVVDPPRKGLEPRALEALVGLGPRYVAYVACEPQSLARDLGALRAAGYRVADLTAWDLFPHTPEVETVAWLERPRG